jgi:ribosomal 50S subunit-recycling heat shock protein
MKFVYYNLGVIMRIDKFLKNSRIIKRRTIAKEACEKGRIMVNGKAVKAGYDVKVEDVIEIAFGDKTMKVAVEKLIEHVKKDDAQEMYRIIV